MKTSELTGVALDWAVAKCEGVNVEALIELAKRVPGKSCGYFLKKYSTDWSQGGPIIDKENISISRGGAYAENFWRSSLSFSDNYVYGPTPLIAAMRCRVTSKLGEEIDIPDELMEKKECTT